MATAKSTQHMSKAERQQVREAAQAKAQAALDEMVDPQQDPEEPSSYVAGRPCDCTT